MKKLTQAYFLSAGMLLFVTGVLKIWSAGGDAAALQNVDGVIGVEVRHLYLLVGLVELLVVGYLLAGRRWDAKCFLLLYLGMSFASYRVLQWWLDIPEPCPCLGSATDWLGRFETSADGVLLGFNVYLIVVSAVFLFGCKGGRLMERSVAGDEGQNSLPKVG